MGKYTELYHTTRCAGSKLNHIEKLYQYFPPLKSWNHFIDPMAGSLAVPLNLPIYSLPFTKRKIVTVNDYDDGLIDLAYCILFYPEQVRWAINNSLKVQGFFNELRDYPEGFQKKRWENGMRKYYLLQMSFSSKAVGTIRYCNNIFRTGHPNHSTNYYELLADRLREYQIFNEDFRKFMKRFIGRVNKGFMYADPPYYTAKGNQYYIFEFNEQDHIDFAELVHKMHETGFLICISYDDNPKVFKLYDDFFIRKVNFTYSLPNIARPTKKELIITNYKTNVMQQGSLDQWI